MGNLPELKSGRVLLRKPEKEDIVTRILFGSPIEFVKMCSGDTNSINEFTLDDGNQWYKKIIVHPCKWVLEYDGSCIGEVALTPYKQDNKVRYSIAIFEMSKWGLGIGTEVAKMVLDYAFNRMKYHKVYLRVLDYNKRAIRCYEKCGFVQEGIDREGARIEGNYETDIYMGIIEDEYRKFFV
ncbi:GNAT family N-acetyltransferase [Desulfosporosinus nitroreducens]|uniref:GNAT family N-acetyltransferase n=1 Tax=Desulfosporosinus nitroreducens TaxID=2018668 RepID=UPI00207D391A|nr:GNAT family protein [Desulfosporosinus nitroreducens]MCO1603962.1 GNAT family N-acetyltransferase [Desulfosporosinus nitroreducens]